MLKLKKIIALTTVIALASTALPQIELSAFAVDLPVASEVALAGSSADLVIPNTAVGTTISSTAMSTMLASTAAYAANAHGTIMYTVKTGTDVVSVDASGNVSIKKPGTATIEVYAAENDSYLKSDTKTVTVEVAKDTVAIGVPTSAAVTYGSGAVGSGCTFASTSNPSITAAAGTLANASISYSSSNTNVATVDTSTGAITPKNAGTTTITVSSASNTYYNASSKQFTFTVNKKAPTLTLGGYSTSYNVGANQFTLSKTYNGDGTISYSSSNSNVLAVNSSTGVVTVKGAGTAVLTVSASAGSNYSAGTSSSSTITVNKMPGSSTQSLLTGFTQSVIYNQGNPRVTLGSGSYAASIRGTSTGSTAPTGGFSYSIKSGGANTCGASISGTTLTYTGSGVVDITATYAGDANYSSASVDCRLTITKDAQTFATPAAITKTYGDAPISLAGHASLTKGNGAISYSVQSQTPNKAGGSVVSISGNTMSITGAGTAVIKATAAATAQYESASVTFTVTVNRATPSITVSNISKTYLDSAFSLAGHATSNSNENPLIYTSSSDVISISGTTVTLNKSGTATVTVSQAQSANYNAATRTFTISVARATPSITVADPVKVYGDSAVGVSSLFHTAGSGFTTNTDGALTLTLLSESPANSVSISGTTITFANSGIASIRASFTQTDRFNAISDDFTITIGKATPGWEDGVDGTIATGIVKTFKDAKFSVKNYYTTNYDLSLAGAGITYSSANPDVLAVDESTGEATVGVAGTTTVTVTLAETRNFSAKTFSIPVRVEKKLPTMSAADISKTYLDPIADLAGHAIVESPGDVSYALKAGQPTDVISISGTKMSILGKGTVIVTVSVSETDNYKANTFDFTVSVARATPTASVADIAKIYGDPSFSLVDHLITNSNGAVTYTVVDEVGDSTAVVSPDDDVLNISADGTVTINHAGTATVRATSAETNQFNEKYVDFTISVAPKTCDVTAANITDKVYLQPDFSLAGHAVTESDGQVTYTSSDPTVIAITGNTAAITGAGIATITVNVAATQNYVAQTCTFTITVDKAQSTLTVTPSYTKLTTDSDFSLEYSASSTPIASTPTCPVVFSSNAADIATVDTTGKVVILASGDVVFTIALAEDDDYYGCSKAVTLHVDRDVPVLSNTGINLQFTDSTYDILQHTKQLFTKPAYGTTGKLAYTGGFTYSDYDTDVIKIENNVLKIVHAGETDVRITTDQTVVWDTTSQTIHVKVIRSAPDHAGNHGSDRDPLNTHKIERTYEDEDFNLDFHTQSDGSISYRSSDDYIATITSSGVVSMHRSSITTSSDHIILYVEIAETRDWEAATIEYELKINKCRVRFENTDPIQLVCKTDPQAIPVTWNSDASYKYTVTNTMYATVDPATKVNRTEGDSFSAGMITAGKAGDTTLVINTDENTRYLAGTVTINVHTERADPNLHSEIAGADDTGKISKHFGDVDFKLMMVSDSDASILYSTADDEIATISPKGFVHIMDIGSVEVTASVARTDYYYEATKTYRIEIDKAIPVPGGSNVDAEIITKYVSDPDFPVGVSFSNGESKATYTIEDTSLAEVNDRGIVTLLRPGTTTIIVSAAETEHYAAFEKRITLIIKPQLLGFTGIDANGMQLHVGDKDIPMNVSIDYSNASTIVDIPLHFTSLNTDIITVTDDGLVTALAKGTGYIKVTSEEVLPYGANSVTVPIKVDLAELQYVVKNIVTAALGEIVDIAPDVITPDAGSIDFIYTVADSNVATVSPDGKLTPVGIGETTITISSAGTGKYGGITEVIKIRITKNTPVISSSSSAIIIAMDDRDVPLNVAIDPTSLHGQTTGLSYISLNPEIVSVTTDGKINPVSLGQGFIKITSASTETLGSAELTIKVTVTNATLRYNITNALSISLDTRDATVAPEILTTGNTIPAFTYTVDDESVLVVDSDGIITPKSLGATIVTIETTDTTYFAKVFEQVRVVVTKRMPTIISQTDSLTLRMDDKNIPLGVAISPDSVVGSSVSLEYQSLDTSVATVTENGYVNPISVGETFIRVSSTANEYMDSRIVIVKVTVTPAILAYTLGRNVTVPLNSVVSVAPAVNSPHAYDVTFTYDVDNEDILAVDNAGVILPKKIGSAIVTVSTTGSALYGPVTETVKVVVTKNSPIISSGGSSMTITMADKNVSLNTAIDPSSISGADIKLEYTSLNPEVVTVTDTGLINPVSLGQGFIKVKSTETSKYSSVELTIKVTVTTASLNYTIDRVVSIPINVIDRSIAPVVLSAGSTAAFNYAVADSSIITVDGNGIITPKSIGTTIVTVTSQDSTYYSAVKEEIKVTITKRVPKVVSDVSGSIGISLADPAVDPNIKTDDPTDDISYVIRDPDIADYVPGKGIVPKKPGNTELIVKVKGTDTSEEVIITIPIIVTGDEYVPYGADANGVTITLGTKDRPLDVKVYGSVTATPKVTYTSADPKIVTVNQKGEITAVAVGSSLIHVSFAATGKYSALSINVPVKVVNDTLNYTSRDSYTVAYGDPAFSIKPLLADTTANPKFTYRVVDNKVVTVSADGVAEIVGVGSTVVSIHADAFGTYEAADITVLITVTKGDPQLSVSDITMLESDEPQSISYTAKSDGTVTFATNNRDIITIMGKDVTPLAVGKAIVEVSIAETDNYKSATAYSTITVNPKTAYDAAMSNFIALSEPAYRADLNLRITVEQFDATKTLPFVVYYEQDGVRNVLYTANITGLAGSKTSTVFTVNTGDLLGTVKLYAQLATDFEGFDSMPDNNTMELSITIPAPEFSVSAARIDKTVKPGQFISVAYTAAITGITSAATFPVQLELDNTVLTTGYITFNGSMNTVSSEISGYLPADIENGIHTLTVRIVPGAAFTDAVVNRESLADEQSVEVSRPELGLIVNEIDMNNVDEFSYQAQLDSCEITFTAANPLEVIKTITIEDKTYDVHKNSTTLTSTLDKSENFLAAVVVESASGTDSKTYYITVRRLNDDTETSIEFVRPDGTVITPDIVDGVPIIPISDDAPSGILRIKTDDDKAKIVKIDDTEVNKPYIEYPINVAPDSELQLPIEIVADDDGVVIKQTIVLTRTNYTPEVTIVNSDELAANTYGSAGIKHNGTFIEYGTAITSVELAKTAGKTHGLVLDVEVSDKNTNQYLKGYLEIEDNRYLIHWNSFDGPTIISARDVSHGYVYIDSSAFESNVSAKSYTLTVEDFSDAAALNSISSTTAKITFAISVLATDFSAYFDADQNAVIISCDDSDASFTYRKSLDNGITWTTASSAGKSIAVSDKGTILYEITLTDDMHNTKVKTVTATVASDSSEVGTGINVYASTSRHADYIYINTNKKNSSSVNSTILNIFTENTEVTE